MSRRVAFLRFGVGSVLGVMGFGLIGESVLPIRWGSLALGVGMMLFGLLLAVGSISARKPRR